MKPTYRIMVSLLVRNCQDSAGRKLCKTYFGSVWKRVVWKWSLCVIYFGCFFWDILLLESIDYNNNGKRPWRIWWWFWASCPKPIIIRIHKHSPGPRRGRRAPHQQLSSFSFLVFFFLSAWPKSPLGAIPLIFTTLIFLLIVIISRSLRWLGALSWNSFLC